jgi:hypothetical protein
MHEEIRSRFNSEHVCYSSAQNLQSSHLLSKTTKMEIYRTVILPVVLCECVTWSHVKGKTWADDV